VPSGGSPIPRPGAGAPVPATSPLPDILVALFIGLGIGGFAVLTAMAWSRRRHSKSASLAPAAARPPEPGAPDAVAQVFVSYSRQDGQEVDRLVEQIKRLGYTVWIDRQSTGSQRYAAPIVRAIRTSRLVALMCSQHAFASDHVIREVYVAGDNKKPFIAFQLDPTEFPDEVLYFVSGFPRLQVSALNSEQLRSEMARLVTV
jgi:TIR domain